MEKFDKIFQTTACLSEETMKAYLDNELSAEDKHIAEQHIADCPMCADALEGLSYMKDPDKLQAYVEQINAGVDARIRPKRKTPLYRIKPVYSIAAALILLFGIGYILKISFFDFKQDSSVAEQMTEQTEKAQVPFEEALPVIEKTEEKKEKESGEPTTEKNDAEDVPEEVSVIEDFEIIESDEILSAENENIPEPIAEPAVAADESEEIREEIREESEKSSPTIKDIQARLKKQAETEETTEASDDKNKEAVLFGNTRSASDTSSGEREASEKMLFSKRSVNTAVIERDYENAVKLYKSGKYSEAAKIFDRIITNTGLHQFDAMWYRALIYKANGDSDKAAELFQKVADSKTKFSKQAAKELEQ